jgi:hypothetical protein
LELLAHLMNLISTANHRDAISGGFMQPEVHIFPNGEADVDEHFYESVMAPYTRALFTKSFRASASKYEQWFPNYERAFNPDADKTLNRMERPFREEFCVSIDQFVSIPHLLGRASVKQHELILEYDEQSFLSFLKDECNLATGSADEYLARFSLPSRRAWNKDLPPGCEENDVWPWRFRRQLSLLMRPLILITDTPHKRWLVYPPLVKRSVAYVIHGIEEAMFPAEHFRSRAMQRFCGEQANRQGNAFTNMVADEVERLGFSARRQVLMSELGVPAHVGDFGDVDVLAWKRGCPIVFVIECKYLRTATSIRDVVDRLADYRGKSDDSLGKHLRRLKWLQSNSTYVSALTAIPTSEIQFEGMLVTDDLVPMQFFAGSAISPRDVVSFDQLALRFDRNV